ncbi:MAG: Ig domain-containing protein [bacterium]
MRTRGLVRCAAVVWLAVAWSGFSCAGQWSSSFALVATDATGYAEGRGVNLACPPISITPPFLADPIIAVPYTKTLTCVGTGPYTFALTAGALPAGLALAPTGVISGTPTAFGTFRFTVTATDSSGCSGSRLYVVTVVCPHIVVSPPTLPPGMVGVPYNVTLTASGGIGPYTFALSSGTLPPGLVLSTAGVLSGTPTVAGTHQPTVTATDVDGCKKAIRYYMVILCPQITLSPPTLPAGAVGTPYSQRMTANGGYPPYFYFLNAGTLPPGIGFNSSGMLSGTPTAAGTYSFNLGVTDAYGCAGNNGYLLDIVACPAITVAPPSLPFGTVGIPYSRTLTASGGTAPYAFAVASGSLPAGLNLAASGVISGTPTAAATSSFVAQATDAQGCTGTRSYTITIIAPVARVDIVVGLGLGPPSSNRVRVFTGSGTPTATDFSAYPASACGTNVASGAIDARQEILTGPGPSPMLGPQIKAFGRDGTAIGKVTFYAFGTLRYGARVAAGNLDVDPFDEILSGRGPGAAFGPQVRGWNFDATAVSAIAKLNFVAYGTLEHGLDAAAGDVDADGFAEILTGAGPGPTFASMVRGFNYDGANVRAIAKIDYNAYALPGHGVNVGSGDVDDDGFAEIATAPGPGPTQPSRFLGFDFDGAVLLPISGFDVTPASYATGYGGRLGCGDVDDSGRADLLTGAGRDATASARVLAFEYTGTLRQLAPSFAPFPGGSGVNVCGGPLGL